MDVQFEEYLSVFMYHLFSDKGSFTCLRVYLSYLDFYFEDQSSDSSEKLLNQVLINVEKNGIYYLPS